MRDEILLTDQQITEIFSDAFGLFDNIAQLIWTRDTIDDFIAAAKNYSECKRVERGEESGYPNLELAGVQVQRGDQRRTLYIVDFGPARAVWQ